MSLNTTSFPDIDMSEAGKPAGLDWRGILGVVGGCLAILAFLGGGSIYCCCKDQVCGWCQRLFRCASPESRQQSDTDGGRNIAQGHTNTCSNIQCCTFHSCYCFSQGGDYSDRRNGVPLNSGSVTQNVTLLQPESQITRQENGGGQGHPTVFTYSEKEQLARLLSTPLDDKDWTAYAERLGAQQEDIVFHKNKSQEGGARWMLNKFEEQGRSRGSFIELSQLLERDDAVEVLCPRRNNMQSGENDPLLQQAGTSGDQVASTSQGSPAAIILDGGDDDVDHSRRGNIQSREIDPLLHEAGGSDEQVASTSQGSPMEIAQDGDNSDNEKTAM